MHLEEEGHLPGRIWDGRVIRYSDQHFSKLGDDASDLRGSVEFASLLQNESEEKEITHWRKIGSNKIRFFYCKTRVSFTHQLGSEATARVSVGPEPLQNAQ